MTKLYIIVSFMLSVVSGGVANVADTTWVGARLDEYVSTERDANQALAGQYVVGGTMMVETPPLPPEQ